MAAVIDPLACFSATPDSDGLSKRVLMEPRASLRLLDPGRSMDVLS
jgi:hypothetical protein